MFNKEVFKIEQFVKNMCQISNIGGVFEKDDLRAPASMSVTHPQDPHPQGSCLDSLVDLIQGT